MVSPFVIRALISASKLCHNIEMGAPAPEVAKMAAHCQGLIILAGNEILDCDLHKFDVAPIGEK